VISVELRAQGTRKKEQGPRSKDKGIRKKDKNQNLKYWYKEARKSGMMNKKQMISK